ncbi:polymorphic toxin type 44 domain-containing protein [Alicyclobacillus acidoterrestris]|uniref:polymorphic toxin type 44 domain-containing protein n=1 Tax=Alicyclobacillus acidoterrestris TaxID=1450 RepID=UPI003F534C03
MKISSIVKAAVSMSALSSVVLLQVPSVYAATNSNIQDLSKPIPSVLKALEDARSRNPLDKILLMASPDSLPGGSPQNITAAFNTMLIDDGKTMQSDYNAYLQQGILEGLTTVEDRNQATADTAYQFAYNERQGGVWDIKQYYGYSTLYSYGGELFSGDDLGNIHYGYVGRAAGFTSTTLQTAGGIVQIAKSGIKLSWVSSYFDQPSDNVAVNEGISLWNKWGFNLPSNPWN